MWEAVRIVEEVVQKLSHARSICLHFFPASEASWWSEGSKLPERPRVGGRDAGQGGARPGKQQCTFQVLLSNVCMAVLGLTFLTFCMKLRSKVHGKSKLSLPVKPRLIGNVPFTLSALGICLSSFPGFHFSTFFHVLRCSVFPSLKFLHKF